MQMTRCCPESLIGIETASRREGRRRSSSLAPTLRLIRLPCVEESAPARFRELSAACLCGQHHNEDDVSANDHGPASAIQPTPQICQRNSRARQGRIGRGHREASSGCRSQPQDRAGQQQPDDDIAWPLVDREDRRPGQLVSTCGLTQCHGRSGTYLVTIRRRSEFRRLPDPPGRYIFYTEHICATMRP